MVGSTLQIKCNRNILYYLTSCTHHVYSNGDLQWSDILSCLVNSQYHRSISFTYSVLRLSELHSHHCRWRWLLGITIAVVAVVLRAHDLLSMVDQNRTMYTAALNKTPLR